MRIPKTILQNHSFHSTDIKNNVRSTSVKITEIHISKNKHQNKTITSQKKNRIKCIIDTHRMFLFQSQKKNRCSSSSSFAAQLDAKMAQLRSSLSQVPSVNGSILSLFFPGLFSLRKQNRMEISMNGEKEKLHGEY